MDITTKDDTKVSIPLFDFNVAGVQFRPSEDIDTLAPTREIIRLVYEPENKFDAHNAIRVEAKFTIESEDPSTPSVDEWRLIGYVPKKSTALLHLARKAGITVSSKCFVNHDALPHDKILVQVEYSGDPDAAFSNR